MVTSSLASIAVIGLSAWPVVFFLNVEQGWWRVRPTLVALAVGLVAAALFICIYLMVSPMKKGCRALIEGSDEG